MFFFYRQINEDFEWPNADCSILGECAMSLQQVLTDELRLSKALPTLSLSSYSILAGLWKVPLSLFWSYLQKP